MDVFVLCDFAASRILQKMLWTASRTTNKYVLFDGAAKELEVHARVSLERREKSDEAAGGGID